MRLNLQNRPRLLWLLLITVASVLVYILWLPERFLESALRVLKVLSDHRELSTLGVGMALLSLAVVWEWRHIIRHRNTEHQLIPEFGQQRERSPSRTEEVMTTLLSIGVTVLFFQFVTLVYAMAFTLGSSTSEAEPTKYLVMADFDGDGDMDYVVGNTDTAGSYDVALYTNNGAGTFTKQTAFTDSGYVGGLAAGDINGDSAVDVALIDGTSGYTRLSVYKNNGTGTFTLGYQVDTGFSLSSVNIADVNGDGFNDIIVTSNNAGDMVSVYTNNGKGAFAGAPSGLYSGATSAAVADMNGDGIVDVVTTVGNSVETFANSGTGSFTKIDTASTVFGDDYVTLGDIDGDGDIDAVISFSSEAKFYTLNNNGAGVLSGLATYSPSGTYPRQVALGDMDNDGDLDILVAVADPGETDAGNQIFLNNGSGTFSDSGQRTTLTDSTRAVVTGDIDADNDLDFVAGNMTFSGDGTAVNRHFVNDQAATTPNTAPTAPSTGFNATGVVTKTIATENTTSGANDTSVGSVQWDNPGNISADDGSYAMVEPPGGPTYYLTGTGLGLALPSNATVTGIKVSIKKKADLTVSDYAVRIIKGGTIGATERKKAGSWGSSYAYYTYGSSTDLWGETWTYSDINNADFGVALSADGLGTAYVDFIGISVYYTTTTTTTADVTLSWGSGSDTESATKMLQYQVRVGTGSNSNNIVSGVAASPNYVSRLMPNDESRTMIINNLPCSDTYYWNVATVDTGYKSTWGTEKAFTLDASCALTIGTPDTAQRHYRWRNDATDLNADPSGSWLAAEDTAITDATMSTTYRIRFNVANSGSVVETAARTYKIQFAEKSTTCAAIGSWTSLAPGGEYFNMVATTHIDPDGQSLTPGRLTSGGYSYVAGEGRDTAATTASIGPMNASTYTELEYSISATGGPASMAGKSYCFRLYDATALGTLDTYTQYPEMTMASPDTTQLHYRWRDDTTALNTDGGWLAAEDAEYASAVQAGTYRLRFQVANSGAMVENTSRTYQIQFADKVTTCAAAVSWTTPVTDADFEMVDSTGITSDGQSLTPGRLTIGGSSYVTGQGRDSANTTSAIGPLAADAYTELEYSIKPMVVSPGNSYCFRLYDTTAAAVIDTYSVYPVLTIASGSPPSDPVTAPDMTAGTDLGASSTDNITKDPTPDFTGSCTTGDTVNLYRAGTTLIGTTTCASSSYTITSSSLTDTTHSITAKFENGFGESGASPALSVTIDTSAPSAPVINDPTPSESVAATTTVAGTCETDATVSIANASLSTNPTTTSCTASAYSTSVTFTTDGAKTLSVTQTDIAGNDSTAATVDVTVVFPPGAPAAAPDLTAGTDLGSSNSDNVTKDTTPDFTGTCTAGETVKIYSGATLLGSEVCPGGGTYTITSSALTAATYAITSTFSNIGGESGAGPSLAVTIDTSTPSAPVITDPTASENITSNASVSGTCEAGATMSVANADLSTNPTTGSCIGGNFTVSITFVSGGAETLSVTQTDVAGNDSLADTVDVTVVMAAPDDPLTAPDMTAGTDLGTSSTDNITKDPTPDFTGSCTDDETVKIYRGGVTLLGSQVCAASTYTITASSIPDGTYSITSTFTNIVGESGPSPALSVTIDTSNPAAPVISDPTDSEVTASTTTAAGTCEISATVSIANADLSTNPTTTSCPAGTFSTSVTFASGGAETLTVTQTDLAGNTSTADTVDITVVMSAPGAPGTAPDMTAGTDTGISSTDDITNDTTPTFTGTCTAGDTVKIYSGATLLGSEVCPGGGTYTITSSALADGLYNITSTFSNIAGESGTSPALAVTIDTGIPAAPTITSPTSGQNVGPGPTVSGTCETSASGSIANAALAVNPTTTSCVAGNYSVAVSFTSGGAQTLTVTQTDRAGNTSPSATVSVTVTMTAPDAPLAAPDMMAATDLGTSSTDNITSDPTPDFTGTCTTGETVKIYKDVTLVGSQTCSGGTYAITSSSMTDGTYAMTVTFTNVVGESGASPALSVTIDTSPPGDPTITSPQSGVRIQTSVAVQGTCDIGSIVSIANATLTTNPTEAACGAGTYDITVTFTGADAQTLLVSAHDTAGSTSAAVAVTVIAQGSGGGWTWVTLRQRPPPDGGDTVRPRRPNERPLTITAFRDSNGNGRRNAKEVTGFAGLSVTVEGTTDSGERITRTGTVHMDGTVTINVPVTLQSGFTLTADPASAALDGVEQSTNPSQNTVPEPGATTALEIGFKPRKLIAHNPCLSIVETAETSGEMDAETLLLRLEDTFGRRTVTGIAMDELLMSRRTFLTLLQRTQCIPTYATAAELVAALAKAKQDGNAFRDLPALPLTPDSATVYSLALGGLPVGRRTTIGSFADLSAPISRGEAVTLAAAVIGGQEVQDGSLPADIAPDDALAAPYRKLQKLTVLPRSFGTTLGATLGLTRDEGITLLLRSAFSAGKIGVVPPAFDVTNPETADPQPTFLTILPPIPERPCITQDLEREGHVTFTDMNPGDPLLAEAEYLLRFGTVNDDGKTLWLLTGTDGAVEYGIEDGDTVLQPDQPVTMLELLRTLEVLRCRPPETAKTVATELLTGRQDREAGSADQRAVRDALGGLSRGAGFAARVMFGAQDRERLYNLSLLSYAPELLRGDTKSTASALTVEEGASMMGSSLLAVTLQEELINPQQAEDRAVALRQAIIADLLGNTATDAAVRPLTRRMLISFLTTVMTGRRERSEETPLRLPLGELWWERVK